MEIGSNLKHCLLFGMACLVGSVLVYMEQPIVGSNVIMFAGGYVFKNGVLNKKEKVGGAKVPKFTVDPEEIVEVSNAD